MFGPLGLPNLWNKAWRQGQLAVQFSDDHLAAVLPEPGAIPEVIPLPSGLVVEGAPLQPEALGDLLGDLLLQQGWSIRQAALALGASRVQTVFQQVLPLAIPGILTGSIIGVAQALGETAPLLLIGMNAFVANIPATPFEQSTALPVQIYLWQGNEMRNFFEARTSAAIIVLVLMMITLNALAIWLRKKFETRW